MKKKKVTISDNILIQTMTITTDINDIPIMATYDVLEGEIGNLLEEDDEKNRNQNLDHDDYNDINTIPTDNELQPCTTISNQQYKHSSQSIIEKTNSIRKFLSNQRNNLINNIELSSSIEKDNEIEDEKEKEEEQLSILRIFAGNINVNATFNSVLVNENTTADQLLSYALERFRLENQQSNGIEYYITVKVMNKGNTSIFFNRKDKKR